MQEKQKELFDQYDMELLHVRRGRGGLLCETADGVYELQMCQYSPKRLEQAFEMKESLMNQGMQNVDQYKRNKEGELLTYDRYQTSYVMKRHFQGKECDIHNIQDIRLAGNQLAIMHEYLKQIPIEGYPVKQNQLEKKTKELVRTKQFLAHKNEKQEFEKLFLQYYELFCKDISYLECKNDDVAAICHGSYQHHHLVMLPQQKVAVIQFENFYVGNQLNDLFQFMRKILEKNQYNGVYADILLQAYQNHRKLGDKEMQFLYCLLQYPEKYWKLANQYMNHRKSFLSPKLTEKLKEAVRLQEKKEKFLSEFRLKYL
jgi:CotS family spore coat protein